MAPDPLPSYQVQQPQSGDTKPDQLPCTTGGESPRNFASAIRTRIEPLGGVDLELPPREPGREPPSFD